MRSYDEPIEVRLGLVQGEEAPAHFVWRRTLWTVRTVIRHWLETDAWWELPGVATLFSGSADPEPETSQAPLLGETPLDLLGETPLDLLGETPLDLLGETPLDLLGEHELWRVEAQRGRTLRGAGVFDLAFDTGHGQWRLARCMD